MQIFSFLDSVSTGIVQIFVESEHFWLINQGFYLHYCNKSYVSATVENINLMNT